VSTEAEGEWNEVEKLITKNTFKNQKAFMYSAYKQQYLELLEKQEYQRVAFALQIVLPIVPCSSLHLLANL